MTEQTRLGDPEDRDRLIHILETALDVRKSSHFFAWTQGPLQGLIPHEIIICGMADPISQEMRMRYYTATRYFRQEHFDTACNSRHGLISLAMRHWRTHRRPLLVPSTDGESSPDPEWDTLLQRLELRNMAAHGLMSTLGTPVAWFGFFRVTDLGPPVAHALELLMPCISAAYSRMLASEASDGGNSLRVANLLSGRESQVLELVRDGHSNAEIADRLGLSVMTAKNHVQNIRRKLKVRTRGQAVAEGIRLGILPPARPGPNIAGDEPAPVGLMES